MKELGNQELTIKTGEIGVMVDAERESDSKYSKRGKISYFQGLGGQVKAQPKSQRCFIHSEL